MTIRVDEAVGVHETEILGLIVGRTTRRKRLGDQVVYLLAALTAEGDQDLDGLAGIADGLGRELSELGVGPQHDRDRIIDDDARRRVVAELWVGNKPERLEEGDRPLEIGDRKGEEDLVDHADLLGVGRLGGG